MLDFININKVQKKYKREIWGGIRQFQPSATDPLYEGAQYRFYEYILMEKNTFPCLIEWENFKGNRFFIEVIRLDNRPMTDQRISNFAPSIGSYIKF